MFHSVPNLLTTQVSFFYVFTLKILSAVKGVLRRSGVHKFFKKI